MADKLCVGLIASAHGVRGLVKLRSFTHDPEAIATYGPLSDETGSRVLRVHLQSSVKDFWIARIDGVTDRDQADALAGTHLFVDRSALPAPDDPEEFYHADLLGLRAERQDGLVLGTVAGIHDFGAGDVIEVRGETGATHWLPFTRDAVPVVDVAGRRLVVDPPREVEA